MGNWESRSLTSNQIAYAANDVFVTYEIAEQLKKLQSQRPDRKFTLPLATVHSKGATTLVVGGTLQERQNRPATKRDVIETIFAHSNKVPGTASNDRGYLHKTSSSITAAAKLIGFGRAPWPSKPQAKAPFKPYAFKLDEQTSTKPPFQRRYRKDVTFVHHDSRSATSEDLSIFTNAGADNMDFSRLGGRSVTTIIIPKLQSRRSFSTFRSSSLFHHHHHHATNDGSSFATSSSSSRSPAKNKKANSTGSEGDGDLYFPIQLLPESLEGKDILERNQAVWLDAGGGGDLSEDETNVEEEEEADWHLNRNQALFASLMSSPSHEEGGEEKQKARN